MEDQFQVADVGVPEPFDAVVADQDVVRGPPVAGLGAAVVDRGDLLTHRIWSST
ncbi:hypothetical protein [Nocardia amikacinitolerans]|uniref:hypothetical protein n=1 Tax=Nocardia amikacinitolerans TaxID=756689 RepID=UPI0020A2CBE1|nr:hypothetical protein [Nocardia amikacinitolerans]